MQNFALLCYQVAACSGYFTHEISSSDNGISGSSNRTGSAPSGIRRSGISGIGSGRARADRFQRSQHQVYLSWGTLIRIDVGFSQKRVPYRRFQ
jgi:hypothetical protein